MKASRSPLVHSRSYRTNLENSRSDHDPIKLDLEISRCLLCVVSLCHHHISMTPMSLERAVWFLAACLVFLFLLFLFFNTQAHFCPSSTANQNHTSPAPVQQREEEEKCFSQPLRVIQAVASRTCHCQTSSNCPCAHEEFLHPLLGINCSIVRSNNATSELSLQRAQDRSLELKYISMTMTAITGSLLYESDKDEPATLTKDLAFPLLTATGKRGLINLQWLLEDVIKNNITGDFIEAGVCTSGAALFASAVLRAYGQHHRKVWLSDCVAGKNLKSSPSADAANMRQKKVSAAAVKKLFEKVDMLDDQVRFLKGSINKSVLQHQSSFAVLKVSSCSYSEENFKTLYRLVSVGGYVIVDNYLNNKECRNTVDRFRESHWVSAPLLPVWSKQGEATQGVWWLKNTIMREK